MYLEMIKGEKSVSFFFFFLSKTFLSEFVVDPEFTWSCVDFIVKSFSHVWLFATWWMEYARHPCLSTLPRVCLDSCPESQWCHPTISSSVAPFSFLPSIFPSIRVFPNESALHIMWPKYLEVQLQHQSFQWIFRVDFL